MFATGPAVENDHSDVLGKQGGNVGDDISLDLSSCVNPYGPAPSVVTALRELPLATLKAHPFSASSYVEKLYSQRLGVEEDALVATRGASEAISHFATLFADATVGLPAPTYTEYVSRFSNGVVVPNGSFWHSQEQLEAAASKCGVVMFSNPHNPTGRSLSRTQIQEVAQSFPQCLFLVDESYMDFLADEADTTLIGGHLPNVAVLRSPTKFFGIGGVRIGVVWSANKILLVTLRSLQTTWPVSMIEAQLAAAAFADIDWQHGVREQLSDDAAFLDAWLSEQSDVSACPGPLHFRLVSGDVDHLASRLKASGIAVRTLSTLHGFAHPAVRISAPAFHDRKQLEALA